MNLIKAFIIACAAISLSLAITAWAAPDGWLHGGSAAECDNCHRIHGGHIFLLTGTDQSSTCLSCHAYLTLSPVTAVLGVNGFTNIQQTPGGDFNWLRVTVADSELSTPAEILNSADKHGHNIIAADFDLHPDFSNFQAPGGTFLSSELSCVSCHDPHSRFRRIDNAGLKVRTGKPIVGSGTGGQSATEAFPVGVYRMLGGTGYRSFGSYAFEYPPPDAVAVTDPLGIVHVAYGRGMSEWCANCHPRFLRNIYFSGLPHQMHPAGTGARLTPEVIRNYNNDLRYRDNVLTTYSSIAPIEEGSSDYARLSLHAATAYTGYTVDAAANVMCLTCHRAHASGWIKALRWSYGHYYNQGGISKPVWERGNELQQKAYAAKHDRLRGLFCNKCHAKD